MGLSGPVAARDFPLESNALTIGRSRSNAVVLANPSVSRRHAVIETDGRAAVLKDLGSRAGTRVNGEVVVEHVLVPGDVLTIGDAELAYLVGERGSSPLSLLDSDLHFVHETTIGSTESSYLKPSALSSEAQDAGVAEGLESLLLLARAVAGSTDVESLAHALIDAAFRATPAHRAGLFLAGAQGTLHPVLAASRNQTLSSNVVASRTIVRRVIAERIAVLDDAGESGVDGPASLAGTGVTSFACMPLVLGERVVGVLWLETLGFDARLQRAHLDVATALCTLTAMPLDAARRAEAAAPASHEAAPLLQRALVVEAERPLDIGGVLALRGALDACPAEGQPTVLVLDWSSVARGGEALTATALERLAALPGTARTPTARASAAPSVARLAALVASASGGDSAAPPDGRAWLRDLLTASSLLALRAERVVMEPRLPRTPVAPETGIRSTGLPLRSPGPPSSLLLARRIGQRLRSAEPLRWVSPEPVAPTQPPLLSLDGEGPMGSTPQGALLVSDSPEITARKIRTARTDAGPVLDPSADMSPSLRNLLLLQAAVSGESMGRLLDRLSGKGYGVLKTELAESVNAFLAPIRRKRDELQGALKEAAPFDTASEMLEAAAREACDLVARTPGLLR